MLCCRHSELLHSAEECEVVIVVAVVIITIKATELVKLKLQILSLGGQLKSQFFYF